MKFTSMFGIHSQAWYSIPMLVLNHRFGIGSEGKLVYFYMVISLFREDFIFTKLRIIMFAKIKPLRKFSEFTVFKPAGCGCRPFYGCGFLFVVAPVMCGVLCLFLGF